METGVGAWTGLENMMDGFWCCLAFISDNLSYRSWLRLSSVFQMVDTGWARYYGICT